MFKTPRIPAPQPFLQSQGEVEIKFEIYSSAFLLNSFWSIKHGFIKPSAYQLSINDVLSSLYEYYQNGFMISWTISSI